MAVPTIHTPRLRLRMIVEDDAPFFFALNSDPLVLKYTGDEPFKNLAAATDFILGYSQYRLFACGRLAVQLAATNEVLGWCGLKYHEDTQEFDIGYRLMRKHWNQGYATEAAFAAIQDGKERLNLQRVVAHIHVGNERSFRVSEKLGMSFHHDYEWGGSLWHQMEKIL